MCAYFVPSPGGTVHPDFILQFTGSTENYMFMSTLVSGIQRPYISEHTLTVL